jgi:hypothetical protein
MMPAHSLADTACLRVRQPLRQSSLVPIADTRLVAAPPLQHRPCHLGLELAADAAEPSFALAAAQLLFASALLGFLPVPLLASILIALGARFFHHGPPLTLNSNKI